MKRKIFFYRNILLLSLFMVGLSCGNKSNHSQDTSVDNHTEHKSEVTSTLSNDQRKNILDGYILIKDALVNSDGDAASNAANNLVVMLGDSKDENVNQIKVDAGHIAGTQDIEHQRGHFPSLSEQVYKLVKNGNLNGTLYWDFCPMANGGKGAYWLSKEKEIKNPYFGDKMLKCGSVKETIQ